MKETSAQSLAGMGASRAWVLPGHGCFPQVLTWTDAFSWPRRPADEAREYDGRRAHELREELRPLPPKNCRIPMQDHGDAVQDSQEHGQHAGQKQPDDPQASDAGRGRDDVHNGHGQHAQVQPSYAVPTERLRRGRVLPALTVHNSKEQLAVGPAERREDGPKQNRATDERRQNHHCHVLVVLFRAAKIGEDHLFDRLQDNAGHQRTEVRNEREDALVSQRTQVHEHELLAFREYILLHGVQREALGKSHLLISYPPAVLRLARPELLDVDATLSSLCCALQTSVEHADEHAGAEQLGKA
eukprot:scaffold149_cov315-Pinguiococcus_pyrenoidosus.AAC.23